VENYWILNVGWAEKAIAKVLFWQSFPLISAVHFLGKMVVLHILNVPRLIASNSRKLNCCEASDLLGKLEFSLSFHGVFEVGISKKLVFVSTNLFFSLETTCTTYLKTTFLF